MLRKKFLTRAVLTTVRPTLVCAFGALVLFAGQECGAAGDDILQALKPVTDAMLGNPAADDWLMRRGNFAGWGYSALDQINAQNVGRLRLAWAWNMEPGYQEEAPLAHDGVLFLASPKNVVQALDGRTGDLLWEYRRQLPKIEGGYHNDLFDRARGTIALYDDKVLLATADAHLVALDEHTGNVVWDTAVADYRQGYTFTAGPLAAKGKVIAGISGCTNPGTSSGCFIVALDAKTGAEVWRTKTIAQPGSPGDDSWHALPAGKRNGGSVWTSGSYDPALSMVYWGTGGPIPHSEIVRGTGDGAVLYTDSTLALDADTGKIAWHRQFLPRDNWNLDHVFEQVLADIDVDGHERQALLTIGKPGMHPGARPSHRRIPVGARDCLSDGLSAHRCGDRASRAQREPHSHEARRDQICLSVLLWRQAVDGERVQSFVEDLVRAAQQSVHGLQNSGAAAAARGGLWARPHGVPPRAKQQRQDRPGRCGQYREQTDPMVGAAPPLLVELTSCHRWRRRAWRRHQPPRCRVRRQQRKNSLAVAAQQSAWRLSNDLHGRRQTVCRDSDWTKPDRQSGRGPADAGNSRAEPRFGAPGVCAA